MFLYLVQVCAVFAVRGRPHSGEAVVAELFPPTGRCLRHWAGPLLSFTWNVVLPVILMVNFCTRMYGYTNSEGLHMYTYTSLFYIDRYLASLSLKTLDFANFILIGALPGTIGRYGRDNLELLFS